MLAEVSMAGRAGALQGSPAWRAHLAALRRIYLVAAVVWQAAQRMALANALAGDALQAAWQACVGAWSGEPAAAGAPKPSAYARSAQLQAGHASCFVVNPDRGAWCGTQALSA